MPGMDPEKVKKIKFASTTEVEYLNIWIEEICDVMRETCECGAPLFVSDLSMMGEMTDEKELAQMSEKLGVPIQSEDFFIDVAKRLKKSRE